MKQRGEMGVGWRQRRPKPLAPIEHGGEPFQLSEISQSQVSKASRSSVVSVLSQLPTSEAYRGHQTKRSVWRFNSQTLATVIDFASPPSHRSEPPCAPRFSYRSWVSPRRTRNPTRRITISKWAPPSTSAGSVHSVSHRKISTSSRSGKNPSNQSSSCAGVSATSLPINAPDWSKILREEHRVGEGSRMTT